MFKAISEIMAHSYELINTFLITINFFNAKKIYCALMFIMSNHYGTKCRLQLEPCKVMFKVISDIMAHWYDIEIYF